MFLVLEHLVEKHLKLIDKEQLLIENVCSRIEKNYLTDKWLWTVGKEVLLS